MKMPSGEKDGQTASEKSSTEAPRKRKPTKHIYPGPAPKKHKLLKNALELEGVPEEEMPKILKDRVVIKGRLGPLGQLHVKAYSGVSENKAKKWLKRFEKNVGGVEDIEEKLEAAREFLSESEVKLLNALQAPNQKKTLARLMAEVGSEPSALFKAYSKGAMALGQVQAAIEASRAMPTLMKDLTRHAIDGTGVCKTCVGLGAVRAQPNHERETQICPECQGSGQAILPASKHKEFAATKLMEIAGVTKAPGGPTVNVNQQVGIVNVPKGSFMERIVATSDEILYRKQADIIDAEEV